MKDGGVIGGAVKGQDVGCHGEDVELIGGDEDGAAGGWVDEAEGVCGGIGFNPCMYAGDVVGQEEGTEPVFVVCRAYIR